MLGFFLYMFLNPQFIAAAELTPLQYEKQTEAIFKEQQEALSQSLVSRAYAQRGKWYGQCVIGVRQFLNVGRSEVSGFAKNTEINSHDPFVGSIIVLNMSRAGHIGVVLYETPSEIYYYDTNYSWNGRAAIHSIAINDTRIKGYHKVQ